MIEQEGLRERLIDHAEARTLLAIRNEHEGQPCIAIGRVVKLVRNYVVVAGRGFESAIPIQCISDVKTLDEQLTQPALVVPGVTDG